MDKKTRKAIHKEMMDSSIADEIQFTLLLASACQNVLQRAHARIKGVYLKHGYEYKESEFFTGLYDYCKSVRSADFYFFERVNSHIINSTWCIGMEENGEGNIEAHQGFENKVNECLRLLMKYLNCVDKEKTYKTIFTALSKLEKADNFEEKEIAHFKINM